MSTILANQVKKELDEDTGQEHEYGGQQENEEQIHPRNRLEPTVGIENKTSNFHQDDANDVSAGHTVEVGKTGVTHHTGVGAHHPEANDIGQEIDEEGA